MNKPVRILLVEDDEMYRLALSQSLADAGYAVTAVAGSSAAIGIVEAVRPDLVISDWMLQDSLHGLELIQALRDEGIGCPVILISGYPSVSLEKQARDLGVASILAKPFSVEVLFREIDNARREAVCGR